MAEAGDKVNTDPHMQPEPTGTPAKRGRRSRVAVPALGKTAATPLLATHATEVDEIEVVYNLLQEVSEDEDEATISVEEITDVSPAKLAELEAEAARAVADLERDLEHTLSLDGLSTDDPVRLYLREIGRTALLKAVDEAELAHRIEAGKRAHTRLYSGESAATEQPWLAELPELPRVHLLEPSIAALGRVTAVERHQLERDIVSGHEARTLLVQANLRLVVSIARRYINRGLNLLDLIQEGNIGLMRASDKFDHRKGFKFSTYATWWIRQAITRAISDQSRTIRLPVHVSETIARMRKVSHELQQSLQREPTELELATAFGIAPAKVQRIMEIAKHPISLEAPMDDNEDSFLGDFIEDEKVATPMDEAAQQLLKEQIDEVLQNLPERERKIIKLRFGLEDGHYRTLEEVAQEFGITRERIRQIEAKILRKLRHSRYGGNMLKEYLQ